MNVAQGYLRINVTYVMLRISDVKSKLIKYIKSSNVKVTCMNCIILTYKLNAFLISRSIIQHMFLISRIL